MSEGNPFGAMIAFWIFMQVVWTLALLGGGLYVLWCLNRIASSVERMASEKENRENTAPPAPLATPQSFTPAQAPSAQFSSVPESSSRLL